MPLSKEERESFLSEPHVAALSISRGPDQAPLTVPIWYQYAPGGEPWILTGVGSAKARAIEAAGRFTLMAERMVPTARYVSVSGSVIRTAPGTEELNRQLAQRYLRPEKVEEFLAWEREQATESILYAIRPEQWLSSDLGEW